MKEQKGYELLDIKAVCKEEYEQDQRRLNRVLGYGNKSYYGSESGEPIEGGFINRNNVEDQI